VVKEDLIIFMVLVYQNLIFMIKRHKCLLKLKVILKIKILLR